MLTRASTLRTAATGIPGCQQARCYGVVTASKITPTGPAASGFPTESHEQGVVRVPVRTLAIVLSGLRNSPGNRYQIEMTSRPDRHLA